MARGAAQPGTPGGDWTIEEVHIIVNAYFELLDHVLRDEPINKAAEYRRLQQLLPARNKHSIEFKFMNVSAVLTDMRLPSIPGLAPKFNYQLQVVPVVEHFLSRRSMQIAAVAEASAPESTPVGAAGELLEVVAPPIELESTEARRRAMASPIGREIDFAEREARNRELGRRGELLVVDSERRSLWSAGRTDLMNQVRHVSVEDGDGSGFDIFSFDPQSGSERLIEVKTTRSGIWMPFVLTRNEVRVSEARADQYRLYRLHEFGARTRVYSLAGSLNQTCKLDPVAYSALPRTA